MKSIFLISLAGLTLVNGFLVKDCKRGEIDNKKDNACHQFVADSVSFESDAGCELLVYNTAHCHSAPKSTKKQNVCFKPGFRIQAVYCMT